MPAEGGLRMFSVDYDTGAIVISKGDTGSFELEVIREDREAWGENDRAVFTVNNGAGETVIERIYRLDSETPGNGIIVVEFHNSDTDQLDPGGYTWEIRLVDGIYTDDDGKIIDGNFIRTPGIDGSGDPMPLTIKSVQAQI